MRFSSPYFVTSVREKKMKIRERKVPDNCRVRNLNSRSLLGCNPLRFDDHLHMSPHVKVSRIPEAAHWNPEFQHKESGIQVLLASEQKGRLVQGIRNPQKDCLGLPYMGRHMIDSRKCKIKYIQIKIEMTKTCQTSLP